MTTEATEPLVDEFMQGNNVYVRVDGPDLTVYVKEDADGNTPTVVASNSDFSALTDEQRESFEERLEDAGYVPADTIPLDLLYEVAEPTDVGTETCGPCECGDGTDEDEPADKENEFEITEKMISK